MKIDAEKAFKYIKLAEELTDIATALQDEKSQQAVTDAARHYEKLAAELTVKRQCANSG